MWPHCFLLLAGAFSGDAAFEHASRLAALGPHAFGSPRTELAAEYVADQLREAGASELQRQRFTSGGRRGVNVVGVLRGNGPGFVVLGAHHDTPEGSPGAWGGAGAALLIEAARALQERTRTRTLVLASWDGGAVPGWPGARAWLDGLGDEARHAVAILVVEGAGRTGGVPLVRAPARPELLRPGRSTVAPAWLVRRIVAGASRAEAPLRVADGQLGWLFQVADRVGVAVRPRGDAPFLTAGFPAASLTDDAPWSLSPRLPPASDTAENLDAAALGRMGEVLVEAGAAVAAGPRGADREARWFAAFGAVLGEPTLLALGAAALVPVAAAALTGGMAALLLRGLQAMGFALLLWRAPVAALWCLLPPHLALLRPGSRLLARIATLPALALVGAVALLTSRPEPEPLYAGLWLAPWEIGLLGFTLVAAHARPPRPRRHGSGKRRP